MQFPATIRLRSSSFQRVMQQIAAGRSVEDVSRELQMTGLAKPTCDALVEHAQQRWQEIRRAAGQRRALLPHEVSRQRPARPRRGYSPCMALAR